MTTMQDIETATREYADNRELLILRLQEMETEIQKVRDQHMAGVKAAVGGARNAKAFLHQLVDENRGLFKRPKSLVIEGITVGLQKGTGSITFADPKEKVIERIEKMFTAEQERKRYIKTEKKLLKKGLQTLDAAALKKLGCTIGDTGDVVVIRATDSEIAKLVNRLLDESAESADEALKEAV